MTTVTDVPLPEMPPGPSPEEQLLIGLRKRYLELAARADEIAMEMQVIKDRLKRNIVGKHAVGDGYVHVTPQKRFDPDLAANVLRDINPDLVATCSIAKVDSGLVKRVVGEDVYERCQKTLPEPKVVVK
jgi:hypothetical protein